MAKFIDFGNINNALDMGVKAYQNSYQGPILDTSRIGYNDKPTADYHLDSQFTTSQEIFMWGFNRFGTHKAIIGK